MSIEVTKIYIFQLPEDSDLLWDFLKHDKKVEQIIDTTYLVAFKEHYIQPMKGEKKDEY